MNYDMDSNNRKGKTVSLKIGLNSLLHSFDESDEAVKKAYRAAKVQSMFKDCCNKIYGDSSFLVLEKINAVYILNEKDRGNLRTAKPNAKNIKRLAIYTNDSMVYADLDSRQEMIKYWFAQNGERIDYFDLYSSKYQMRKRQPYKNDINSMKNSIIQQKNNDRNLIPHQNPEELMPLIKNIKDENLQKALINLINH